MAHVGAVGSEMPRGSWWLRMFFDSASLADDYSKTHARVARDVMSTNVVTVSEDTPLREVAKLLEKHRIKRAPVVRDGRLVGIITRANLLQALAASPASAPVSSSDQTISERLSEEMAAQSWGTYVNALVHDGVVQLWGFVDSESERRALRILAENVPGVRNVEDHLTYRLILSAE